MSELILQPTPNWFTSRPIDICQTNGTVACSAICSIILTNDLFDKYSFTIKDAHTKRIIALVFYKNSDYLASCAEDLDIKVWNITTNTLANQHSLHQNLPTCLDWLNLDDSTGFKTDPILISCDNKGNIFKWNLTTGNHVRYFPENKSITQVRSCPKKWLIAVGYKQGTIVILDIKSDTMKINHKLKSHEDTINCLCWYPFGNNNSDKEIETLYNINDSTTLLTSSSEDGTIRVWCTLKGEQLDCFKAPGFEKQSRANSDKQKNKIKFIPLCWPSSSILISGSFKGDLCYFDLLTKNTHTTNDNSIKWRNFTSLSADKAHKKIIYEICTYSNQIISFSLDRSINIWNLKTFKQESSLSTLNGYIYSIISSPIDSNVLAISVGDSSVKFLNEKQVRKVTKSFSNNINSEVTQICWHPTKESIIAFGTKDGKVGLFDYMSNNKPAQFIYSNYNQSVYTLLWSVPIIPDVDIDQKSKFALYSVADGKINQHFIQFQSSSSQHLVNSNTKTLNLYNELNKYCDNLDSDSKSTKIDYGLTEFLIINYTNDQLYFMIGKFDGSIELFKRDTNDKFTKLCSLFNHQKLITSMKWNKQNNASSELGSNLIASGSNDFNVVIIDLDQVLTDIKNSNLMFAKYKHKLIGHKERITCLNWSRHGSFNLLASSSYDSTVQIWNAESGEPLANYRGHSDKILCCLFSNYDSNIVYSGGEDYSLHKWKIDLQQFKVPPEDTKLLFNKKKCKIARKVVLKKHESEMDVELKEEIEMNFESNEKSEAETELKQIKKKESKTTSQRELKSILVLSSHGNKTQKSKLKDCLDLYEILYENNLSLKESLLNKKKLINTDFESMKLEFTSEQINLHLFGNRTNVLKLIEIEQAELKRLNNEKWWYFDVWLGDLAKTFHWFKEQSLINDLIFNLFQISQSSNPNTLLFSNEYIDQLAANTTSNEYAHKAVLYSLASFNVHKAIEIYCSKNMYQYALCVAQSRLSPFDETINKIFDKYAVYATFTGDYETAVMCYIRLGDFENAYKILIRRNFKNDSEIEELIKKILQKFQQFIN